MSKHRPLWHLRTRLASGLVALVPLVVTVAVLRFAFSVTAGILLPFIVGQGNRHVVFAFVGKYVTAGYCAAHAI